MREKWSHLTQQDGAKKNGHRGRGKRKTSRVQEKRRPLISFLAHFPPERRDVFEDEGRRYRGGSRGKKKGNMVSFELKARAHGHLFEVAEGGRGKKRKRTSSREKGERGGAAFPGGKKGRDARKR